jgi:outer membrane protein TolC
MFVRYFLVVFTNFILISAYSQELKFTSLNEVLNFTDKNSISLKTNTIKLEQAKKAKLAAILAIPEISGNILSGSFTDNTRLPVNVFPAEVFGGAPGTYKEIQTGVQYSTVANNYLDIKVLNPQGWENLRLAKLNIELTNSNNELTLKNLRDNITITYYNIINLQEQLKSNAENIKVADTLYQIVANRYNAGLVKSQDVNDSKVTLLTAEENKRQAAFLLEQYYTSLKILCDIPDSVAISIVESPTEKIKQPIAVAVVNRLEINNNLLKEKIAQSNIRNAKLAFSPTASFVFSNSYQTFNTSFTVLGGNWINSNYIGLRLNIPIPSANAISKKYSAAYDLQIAQKNTAQASLKAQLNTSQLTNDYHKAISQYNTNKEIVALRQDSWMKNKNLYTEGLTGLDQVLNSYNSMINAQQSMIASQVNILLAAAKIDVNNKN